MKRFFKLVLLVIWIIAMWTLSAQNSDVSTKTSQSVMNVTRSSAVIDMVTLRNMAHIGEYIILSILAYWNTEGLNTKRRIILTFIFCFAFSISDEIHQHFVPGREVELFDIGLDSLGFSFGCLLCYGWESIKKRLAFY